jgi:hypothetical protein
MSCVAYASQIDLRFREAASQLADFGVGGCPGNFVRECFHFFGQGRIGIKRQTQTAATRVSCRTEAALRGFWAGTSPSILAVGLDFRIARQAAVFPLVGVVSTT